MAKNQSKSKSELAFFIAGNFTGTKEDGYTVSFEESMNDRIWLAQILEKHYSKSYLERVAYNGVDPRCMKAFCDEVMTLANDAILKHAK